MQKDKAKGNIANNYQTITCLPLVWKLLTGILANEIYDYLEKKMLLPEELKGCRQKYKGQVICCLLTKWYFERCDGERKT